MVAHPSTSAITVAQWRMAEITLTSSRNYAKPLEDVVVTATFSGPDGTSLIRPAFWDGGRTWRIRFAPTRTGSWTMITACSDTGDSGLHGATRTISASPYAGDLPIFRHGFLKIGPTGRYLAMPTTPLSCG